MIAKATLSGTATISPKSVATTRYFRVPRAKSPCAAAARVRSPAIEASPSLEPSNSGTRQAEPSRVGALFRRTGQIKGIFARLTLTYPLGVAGSRAAGRPKNSMVASTMSSTVARIRIATPVGRSRKTKTNTARATAPMRNPRM